MVTTNNDLVYLPAAFFFFLNLMNHFVSFQRVAIHSTSRQFAKL